MSRDIRSFSGMTVFLLQLVEDWRFSVSLQADTDRCVSGVPERW